MASSARYLARGVVSANQKRDLAFDVAVENHSPKLLLFHPQPHKNLIPIKRPIIRFIDAQSWDLALPVSRFFVLMHFSPRSNRMFDQWVLMAYAASISP